MNNGTALAKVVAQVFLEKSLHDFYCQSGNCIGWETNVINQREAVNNIVKFGADRIAAGNGIGDKLQDAGMARMIDHTLLKADATEDEVSLLCREAAQHKFASVCVNPGWVSYCAGMLRGTGVKVCTVVGFPLGATTTETKRYETEQAIKNGAEEIDMVINVGKLKSGDYNFVFNDIQQIVLLTKKNRLITKVIIETALLTDEEKVKVCLIAKKAGADFVKTSTGFSKGGATVGDVALMKFVVGSAVGVKASGGIRTKEDAEAMTAAGANRIGASASVKIIGAGEGTEKGY